jgi:hypothetical protein
MRLQDAAARPASNDLSEYLARDRRVDREHGQVQNKVAGLVSPRGGTPEIYSSYEGHRRQFIQGGPAAFTVDVRRAGFPDDLALAQGSRVRNFVVLYLSGGNDALSMLVPYNDPFYHSRGRPCRPRQRAADGTDSSKVSARAASALDGLKQIFDPGRARAHSAHGYPTRADRISGHRHLVDGDPANSSGLGWVGRYLRFAAVALDPLVGWNTTRDLPHVLQSATRRGAGDSQPAAVLFNSPEQHVSRGAAARPGGR